MKVFHLKSCLKYILFVLCSDNIWFDLESVGHMTWRPLKSAFNYIIASLMVPYSQPRTNFRAIRINHSRKRSSSMGQV